MDLREITLNAIDAHHEGVTHVQLVKYILKTEYRHPECLSTSLSTSLMKVVHDLCREGVIEKNLETRNIKSNLLVKV